MAAQAARANPRNIEEARARAARSRTRSVRVGFVVGVVLGTIFIALVLAPWAASVAMRGKGWADPPPIDANAP